MANKWNEYDLDYRKIAYRNNRPKAYMIKAPEWYEGKKYHGGYIFEHRFIMECCVKRYLLKKEIVHHKDGNPLNNDLDNLILLSQSEHQRIHHIGDKHHSWNKNLDKICFVCGNKFHGQREKSTFCSIKCYKYWRRNKKEFINV